MWHGEGLDKGVQKPYRNSVETIQKMYKSPTEDIQKTAEKSRYKSISHLKCENKLKCQK